MDSNLKKIFFEFSWCSILKEDFPQFAADFNCFFHSFFSSKISKECDLKKNTLEVFSFPVLQEEFLLFATKIDLHDLESVFHQTGRV